MGLVTISTFAKKAGISRQAVYKKLDGTLKDFVVIVGGRQLIDERALDLETAIGDAGVDSRVDSYIHLDLETVNPLTDQVDKSVNLEGEIVNLEGMEVDKSVNPQAKTVNREVDRVDSQGDSAEDFGTCLPAVANETQDEITDLLRRTVEMLQAELVLKTRQIEQVTEENRQLSEKLLVLTDKVSSSLQALTHTQLAEKMIEGQRIGEHAGIEASGQESPARKKWWQIWR